MRKATSVIFKGFHFSWPPYIERVEELNYEITFNESCIYDHGDIDQWDWNKLIGVKKNFFSPRKNSFMVGWRWNKEKDRLELTNYSHDENGEVFFNDKGIFYISRSELKDPVVISLEILNYKWVRLVMQSKNHKSDDLFQRGIKSYKGWLIRNWYGGTKAAPHKITINYNKIK